MLDLEPAGGLLARGLEKAVPGLLLGMAGYAVMAAIGDAVDDQVNHVSSPSKHARRRVLQSLAAAATVAAPAVG